MLVTVNPCFHWVGYHLCSALLQEGIEVVGIDDMREDKSDHLYMYIGRNSNFQHFYTKDDKESYIHQNNNERVVTLVGDQLHVADRGSDSSAQLVELPSLFGEWMTMDKIDVRSKDELYQWVKDNDAVYVGDFVKSFIPYLLSNTRGVSEIVVETETNEERMDKNLTSVWKTFMIDQSIGL